MTVADFVCFFYKLLNLSFSLNENLMHTSNSRCKLWICIHAVAELRLCVFRLFVACLNECSGSRLYLFLSQWK